MLGSSVISSLKDSVSLEDSASLRRIDFVFDSSLESHDATGRLNREGLVRRLLPESPILSPEDHRAPDVKRHRIFHIA